VEEKLAVINGGKSRFLRRCRTEELTPALGPAEAAEEPAPERTPQPEAGSAASAEVGTGLSPEREAMARALRDAAEFGMIGLLGASPGASGKGRKEELEKLRSSPLLIDEAQKKKIAELIAEEESKVARGEGGADGAPTPGEPGGAGDGDAKKGSVRPGAAAVNGRLPPEVIQRIVRQSHGRFRLCYENGLGRNPALEGRIVVRFVIERDGSVSNVKTAGSDLPDPQVVACVARVFEGMSFPQPEGGIVTVSYPLVFSPGT
jgi:hypothetical protein